MQEQVTISKQEYDRLVEDSEWLSYLEAAGVDNWEGVDEAMQIRKKDKQLEDQERIISCQM